MEFIIAFFQSQLMLGNAKYDIKEAMEKFSGYVSLQTAYCKTFFIVIMRNGQWIFQILEYKIKHKKLKS